MSADGMVKDRTVQTVVQVCEGGDRKLCFLSVDVGEAAGYSAAPRAIQVHEQV